LLQQKKEVVGEQHPDTLTSMSNLASTSLDQRQLNKVEKLEVQVLELRKEVLGKGHPDILTAINNLAITYLSQGRDEDASKLCANIEQND
jgi:hypothetical protein